MSIKKSRLKNISSPLRYTANLDVTWGFFKVCKRWNQSDRTLRGLHPGSSTVQRPCSIRLSPCLTAAGRRPENSWWNVGVLRTCLLCGWSETREQTSEVEDQGQKVSLKRWKRVRDVWLLIWKKNFFSRGNILLCKSLNVHFPYYGRSEMRQPEQEIALKLCLVIEKLVPLGCLHLLNCATICFEILGPTPNHKTVAETQDSRCPSLCKDTAQSFPESRGPKIWNRFRCDIGVTSWHLSFSGVVASEPQPSGIMPSC